MLRRSPTTALRRLAGLLSFTLTAVTCWTPIAHAEEQTTVFLGKYFERRPDGTTINYIYAGDLLLAADITAPSGARSVQYVHPDHLGSPSLITDEAARVIARTEYMPYGSVAAASSLEPSAFSAFGFTGQRLDAPTGLHYYHGRYYDSQLGRFIQPDPFVQAPADPQFLNRYTYVRNNPVNMVDPSGNFAFLAFLGAILVKAAIGAAVGAAVNASIAAIRGEPIGPAAWRGAFAGAASGGILGAGGFLIGGQALALTGTVKTLAEVGLAAASGAVGGGVDSRLQGGSFAAGLLPGVIGGLVGIGTAKGLGAAFRIATEGINPNQIGNQVALSQQVQQWLSRVGLGRGGSSVDVFRVEAPVNTRIAIGSTGGVSIPDTQRMLFLNFGQPGRANAFLQQRLSQGLPASIKSFKVHQSFLDRLRQTAVQESETGLNPNNPLLVDVTKAPDQFGLRTSQIQELLKNIIQGSGKVIDP